MKKSLVKSLSVILSVIMLAAGLICFAAAETAAVEDQSLNDTDSVSDAIEKKNGARDIYLVLDVSGSMSGEPIESLRDAAKQFCATMLKDKDADNRISIITYGTDVKKYSFSTDYATLANIIDNFEAKGSTAMYDALVAVKEIDEKYGDNSASKHVVVMADGLPNVGATLSTGKYAKKDSSMYYKYGNAVYSTAAGMWPVYNIYSIGFFHNLSGGQLEYGKKLMKDIQNTVYLEVFDPDKLWDAFNGVLDDITGDDDLTSTTAAPATTTTAPATTTTAPATTAAPTAAPKTTSTAKPAPSGDKIPQTGGWVYGATAASLVMLLGIAVVASKKRED